MSQAARDKDHEKFLKQIAVEQSELRVALKERNFERALSIAGYIADELREMLRD